ncbi:bifunctional UDP-N-acetylglucosamine diphosphorylase/glucosamine-1-phosphate N-acetyltransferase GlmU [Inhella sp.]|uniref:bifunctional UDP-N-acetylglucosamine diphosphorylase/glucosamine-1-phosphate N-acetyltransferase GlmU n=1 Tax=Inhella sp. TaxID=1921806 RepID=UPI0035B47220
MAHNIVVMAAGKGTRMKSALPKVLHPLAGRALVQHVLDTMAPLPASRRILITGHGAEAVEARVLGEGLSFARQMPQLGTGHAVQQALPLLDDAAATTLILNGDTPLVRRETAEQLAAACAGTCLALLTVELADPSGYGRILRDASGAVLGIREHKDASDAERQIREGYTGMMAAPTALLRRWLGQLTNDNAQGEYYLTDIVAMAVAEGVPVVATLAGSESEVLGVNDPLQLADLERRFQRQQAESLMRAGVRLLDPARFDLRGRIHHGCDVQIDVGCVFEGEVELGDGVQVGAHCVIKNARIAAGAVIHPFTHIEGDAQLVEVGEGALVGPFARLRPGARLGREVHIGNFVEVKNSQLAAGAKANHLAYLGDAEVGERVNYGAGSITANYDGAAKHRTVIEADVHVGSNCVLVAPVRVGAGSTLGGGSTISRDVPPDRLAVARARQVLIEGWKRPTKKPKGENQT